MSLSWIVELIRKLARVKFREFLSIFFLYLSSIESLQAAPDSLNLHLESRILDGPAFSVSLEDSLAYVGTGGGFFIFNVENPLNPVIRSHLYLPHYAFAIRSSNGVAYIGDWLGGVLTINVFDPSTPSILGRYYIQSGIQTSTTGAYDLSMKDTILYVAYGDSGLRILNVNDPANPFEIGSYITGGAVFGLTIIDTIILLSEGRPNYTGKIRAISVANPSNPYELTSLSLPIWCMDVAVLSNSAYINAWNRLFPQLGKVYKVDLFLPDSIVLDTFTILPGQARKITTDSSYIYACRRDSGLRILNPSDLSQIGNYISDGGVYSAIPMDSLLYLANEEMGLSVLNISNPTDPIKLSAYDIGDWSYELALQDTLLYVTYLNDGLVIINISDPSSPQILSQIDTPGKTYGVYILHNKAYLADGDSGFTIADISDPSSPLIIGNVRAGGTAYSVTGNDSVAYLAIVKSLASPLGHLGIIDTKTPQNPIFIDTLNTYGRLWDSYISGNFLFLAIDSTISSYRGALGIMDISDFYSPAWLSRINLSGAVKSVLVADNYAILGMTTGGPATPGGRIQIMDISNPESPDSLLAVDTEGSAGGGIIGLSKYENLLFSAVWHPSAKEVQVYDLSFLPDSLPLIAYYGTDLQPWDVVSDGDYVYVSNMDFSLYILKSEITGIGEADRVKISPLYQILPNPFSYLTSIRYSVVTPYHIEISIYNSAGQLVKGLVSEDKRAGNYTTFWDGSDINGRSVSSGVYFCQLKLDKDFTETQRLIKIKK